MDVEVRGCPFFRGVNCRCELRCPNLPTENSSDFLIAATLRIRGEVIVGSSQSVGAIRLLTNGRMRDEIEREIIIEELRWLEARALDSRLVAVVTSFNFAISSRKFGLSLNEANVILRIDADGLAAEDGTLRVGDRLIAVNTTPINIGDSISEVISGLDQVTFVVARRVATEHGLQARMAAAVSSYASPAQQLKTPAELAKEIQAQAQNPPDAGAERTTFAQVQNVVGSAVSTLFSRQFGKKDGPAAKTGADGGNSSTPTLAPSDASTMEDFGAIGIDSLDVGAPPPPPPSSRAMTPPPLPAPLPAPPPSQPPDLQASLRPPPVSGSRSASESATAAASAAAAAAAAAVSKKLGTYFPTRRKTVTGGAPAP